jgi:membrane-bound lytic murein transglycosylase D
MRKTVGLLVLSTLASCSLKPINRNTASKTHQVDNKPSVPSELMVKAASTHHSQAATTNENASEAIQVYADQTNRESLDVIVENNEVKNESQEAIPFLAPMYNDTVAGWVDYFTNKDKARFERFLTNGEKYRSIIEEVFKEHGLPQELFYVGLIESGYYLGAKSIAKAVGPWQFMPATGRRYGLVVSHSIDERRSIYKATHAAARYFTDLYNIFGSWELALSAYNAGEYGVIRRITAAKTRDFYELCRLNKLPKETQNYVPKVLAVMKIMENPERYGVEIRKPELDIYANTQDLSLKGSTSLTTIANKLNTNVQTLKVLNPDIMGYSTPALYSRPFVMRIPSPGNHVNLSELAAKENPIKNVAKQDYVQNTQKRYASNSTYHRVRRGENLSLIAKKYRTSVVQLKRMNRISGNFLKVGQSLKVRQAQATSSRANSLRYVVKRGDSLTEIARNNRSTVQKIMRINKLKRSTIYPGQRLLISQN